MFKSQPYSDPHATSVHVGLEEHGIVGWVRDMAHRQEVEVASGSGSDYWGIIRLSPRLHPDGFRIGRAVAHGETPFGVLADWLAEQPELRGNGSHELAVFKSWVGSIRVAA